MTSMFIRLFEECIKLNTKHVQVALVCSEIISMWLYIKLYTTDFMANYTSPNSWN